jgi:hypothetical protein
MKARFIPALLAVILFGLNTSLSQRAKEVKKTVDLNTDGRVSIKTYKGSITIDTWEKAQVDIVAKIEPDGWSREDERNVRETEIRIDDSPNSLRIESDYDRLKRHRSHSFFGIFSDDDNLILPFVHYTITMPRTAKLEINDYKSESRITNLQGPIRMETYKGSVIVNDLAGSINLETYKGEVKIDMTQLVGDSKVETRKGTIDIGLDSRAGCELDVDLGRHADFHSDFETVVRTKHRGEERYKASINGGGPLLRIESEKGDVRLRKK